MPGFGEGGAAVTMMVMIEGMVIMMIIMDVAVTMIGVGESSDRRSPQLSRLGCQLLAYLLELIKLSFGIGPSSHLLEINLVLPGDEARLDQALPIAPVVVGSKPVFHTVGWRDDPESPCCECHLVYLPDWFCADSQRPRRKLNEESGGRMREAPSLFGKPDLFHGLADGTSLRGMDVDQVWIPRDIPIAAVYRSYTGSGVVPLSK
jgi:hypothetical protein